MRGHEPSFPCKNQEISVSYQNRTYVICSPEQLDYLVMMHQERTLIEAAQQGKKLTPEEIKAIVDKYAEDCGFITLDKFLAKMTPTEKKAWEDSYRFTPITRRL